MSGQRCALDSHPNFAESYIASRRSVISKRSETTVVCSSKLRDRQKRSCLENALAHLNSRFDHRIDRIDYAYKYHVIRTDDLTHYPQNPLSIRLAGHLQIETPHV